VPGAALSWEVTRRVPRGRAIPGVREQLFEAADKILARDGPDGLTSRAITDEAGVAKGILHNHFTDLGHFLTQYALDRISRTTQAAAGLPSLAGHGTVAGNLTKAAMTVFGPPMLQVSALLMSRPALMAAISQALTQGGGPFAEPERAVRDYLDAEKNLGRIAQAADTQMIAFTLLGSVHHLFFTSGLAPLAEAQVHQITSALLSGLVAPPATTPGSAAQP
jgi:AcrR family transcriptional regulator